MARPSSAEIRAAYEKLGLHPGAATLKDAKRAHLRLMKQVHPDAHPNASEAEKAEWAKKAAEVNDAFDVVLAHLKRGGKLFDVDADTVSQRPTGPGVRFDIWEVVAPAGAGKTTKWAEAVAKARPHPTGTVGRRGLQWPPSTPRHMIFAAPTIDLLDEVLANLKKSGCSNVVKIDSSEKDRQVNYQLADFFAKIKAKDDTVLLITHAALFNLPTLLVKRKRKPTDPTEVVFDRAEWDLVIDEAPEVLTFHAEKWPLTHRIISDRVTATAWNDYLYQLEPNSEAAVTYFNLLKASIPEDTNITEGTRKIAEALTNLTQRLVLVSKPQWDDLAWRDAAGHSLNPWSQMVYQGALDVMIVITPATFSAFRSATIMGARLESTMYHKLWQKMFHVSYHRHPLQEKLPMTHKNGRRLRLYYMVEEPATREMLSRKAEDGSTMFDAMAKRVGEFFQPPLRNRQFIWSAPLDRGSVYGVKDMFFQRLKAQSKVRPGRRAFDPALRLSGRAMGQNKFVKYHNAVLLNVVNFSPNQWTMLHSVGLKDKEIYRALTYNIAYQDLLRCSIRDTTVKDIVNGIVIDKATAEDIAEDFPGCKVGQAKNAPKRATPKRPGRKADPNDKRTEQERNRDRQRKWAAKQRDAKQRSQERRSESE